MENRECGNCKFWLETIDKNFGHCLDEKKIIEFT